MSAPSLRRLAAGLALLLASTATLAAEIGDARTPKEFSGDDVRAIRGGHIPGAMNLPFENHRVDPDTPATLAAKTVASRAGMSLKPTEEPARLKAQPCGPRRDPP